MSQLGSTDEELTDDDRAAEHANNLVATGAVWMALLQSTVKVTATLEEEGSGNTLLVMLPFMNSPYRVTIERVRTGDEPW